MHVYRLWAGKDRPRAHLVLLGLVLGGWRCRGSRAPCSCLARATAATTTTTTTTTITASTPTAAAAAPASIRARAAPLQRLYFDEPVFRGHVLHLRERCARERSVGAGRVWVLEVQLFLKFVRGEDIRLRWARVARAPGASACVLVSGGGRVAVPVVRSRRRRRRGFGALESQVLLEPFGHGASASLTAPTRRGFRSVFPWLRVSLPVRGKLSESDTLLATSLARPSCDPRSLSDVWELRLCECVAERSAHVSLRARLPGRYEFSQKSCQIETVILQHFI